MGLTSATLNGHAVTHARASLPAWGCWYAEVSIDGEFAIAGAVTLVIADLTLKGTVLSGGAAKGRSSFRIVGGAGGWGKTIPKNSYANDAGVKLATVIGDAAAAAGETMGAIDTSIRVGPAWTRPADCASRVLELLAPSAWYVDESGITQLGTRPSAVLPAGVTHGPVDVARGTVTLASETIAAIRPGVIVDGLVAVDVLHEINAKKGLRSTIWGANSGGTSRGLSAFRGILDQLDPDRAFRGVTEYRVVTLTGKRCNLQPVRVSTGMPDLLRVPVRPGVAGCDATAALGSRVLVGFVNSDPGQPFVASFEDPDGAGFTPTAVNIQAGGQIGGEHVMTVEAALLLHYNVLVALMTAAGGGPLLAAVLQPLIAPAIVAACSAAGQGAPAPPGLIAQTALNITLGASMASGTAPSSALGPLSAALASLATKTANVSGFFPSIGAAAVKAG